MLPIEQGTVSLWRMDGILLFSTDYKKELGSSHYGPTHPPKPDEDFFEHQKRPNGFRSGVFVVQKNLPALRCPFLDSGSTKVGRD